MVSNDLKWNVHEEMISKKVAARLYFLGQLKRAIVPANDLPSFYTTCIRPVFHTALPQCLSDQSERKQRRAPFNIPTLYDRREAMGNLMFQEIIISADNNHKLHPLLPPLYFDIPSTAF